MNSIEPGMKVTALYKTGKYIGEAEMVKNGKVLVSVLAVLKHPKQGDLHNPNQVDVPFFHQRKALAFHEKTWAPEHTVKPYEEHVPEYAESLKASIDEMQKELEQRADDWSARSLSELSDLKIEYRL
jgi:kinase-associated protein B